MELVRIGPVRPNQKILYLPGRWQKATPFSLLLSDGDPRMLLANAGFDVLAMGLPPAACADFDDPDYGLAATLRDIEDVAAVRGPFCAVVGFSMGAALATLMQDLDRIPLVLLDGTAPTCSGASPAVRTSWSVNPAWDQDFRRVSGRLLERPLLESITHSVRRWPMRLLREIAQTNAAPQLTRRVAPVLAVASGREGRADTRMRDALSHVPAKLGRLLHLPNAGHQHIVAGSVARDQVMPAVVRFLRRGHL